MIINLNYINTTTTATIYLYMYSSKPIINNIEYMAHLRGSTFYVVFLT